MTPSAPTAMAARESGTTRSRRPPACDGSTMIGRWLIACTTGTAEMSRVLRVLGSKVRMPRSQRTTSRLPRWATYSAAISHSSMVEVIPRLSSTGLPHSPTACSSPKLAMLRVPICSMSACSATTSTSRASTISVTTGSPVTSRTSARISRPFTPRPWKAYGEVRGLNAPPRSSVGAGGLGHLGRLERLLGRLDRARTGDQGERVRADRHLVAGRADVDRGPLGVVLQADQLERVGDPVDVLDAGHAAQVEAVEGLDVADQADDRAHDAAADERLSARLLDPLGHVGDLLLRRPGSHHNDHGSRLGRGVRMPDHESSIWPVR